MRRPYIFIEEKKNELGVSNVDISLMIPELSKRFGDRTKLLSYTNFYVEV